MEDEKKEKKKKDKRKLALNARIKIVNYDEMPDLNGCIGFVRSKPKKSGRVKIIFPNTTDTMKIPTTCVELCPLPMSVLRQQAQEYLGARVRLISACDEDQKSTDVSSIEKVGFDHSNRSSQMVGTEGGACTSALLNILYEHQNSKPDLPLSFGHIIKEMRSILQSRGYHQKPQVSSSRPMQVASPWEFVPTEEFSGTRRALIIGIRYKGMPWELPGTHNDCHNMMKYLQKFHGFAEEDFTILMDDGHHTSPTRSNMLKAFRKFAFECRPNDAVYFHFAGHGGSVPDESGDETDGLDETLYPVDYLEAGEILDDEIFSDFLLHISPGVALNAVVDSCHSGSVFDLPFELFGPGKGLDGDYSAVHFPHMELAQEHRRKMQRMKEERGKSQRVQPSPQIRAKKKVQQQQQQRSKPQQQRPTSSRSMGHGGSSSTSSTNNINRPLPLEATVILVDLQRQPDLNGRTGIVKSRIGSNGRQHVFIKGLAKSFALKPANMQLKKTRPAAGAR